MKKRLNIIGLTALIAFGLSDVKAQTTFPSGTNLCENTPWKLVWYDEFNGTAINTDKWFTFLDDANWDANGVIVPPVSQESRTMNRGVNFMDANVTVSGGTCKLTAKYQPNTWINSYKQYTSGLIKAKKSGENVPRYFNKGRFEMSARITKAEKTWAAYWLWQGGGHSGGDSEIDMFEYMPTNNANENTYSLHGWNRPGTSSETTVTGIFSYNDIDAWHTYVCEWDNNFVRIYMDNQLKYEGSRYTLPGSPNTSSSCQPASGTNYVEDVNKAFPFADEYMSLICSMDYRDNIEAGRADAIFEIDYIRVYQRTPQSDLKDLCTSASGPAGICINTTATYYATIGEGTFNNWDVGPGLQTLSSGVSNGQPYITVKGTASASSWVTPIMQGSPPICGSARLRISVGTPAPPAPSITTNATSLPSKKSIKITFPAPPSGTTYTWVVTTSTGGNYNGINGGSQTFLMTNGDIFGYRVYATTSCGQSEDVNFAYKLVNGVLEPHELVKPGRPSDEKTAANGLSELMQVASSDGVGASESAVDLYPNPVDNILSVHIKELAVNGNTVTRLSIIDMSGRTILEKNDTSTEQIKKIDVSRLAPGMYRILITAGEKVINRKFVKQ